MSDERETECPMCLDKTIGFEYKEESFKYGIDGPNQVTLTATVLVGSCTACGFSWTGQQAEKAYDDTVAEWLKATTEPGEG